jgi:hypothetical protein
MTFLCRAPYSEGIGFAMLETSARVLVSLDGRLERNSRCSEFARAAKSRLAPVVPCALATVGVAACTWISFQLGHTLASVAFR